MDEPIRPANTSPTLWEKLKPIARQMRCEPTAMEDRLWQRLRRKALCNTKFRRQHVIDRFIVDFYCPRAKLVIEVDGQIHEYTQEEDQIRQEFLEEVHGLTFLRFTNEEVQKNLEGVLERIVECLDCD